jgi:hypothetical protein
MTAELHVLAAPAPLCRDCRWCRPSESLAFPIVSWFPASRRIAWRSAMCRHPTSVEPPRPPDVVLGTAPRPRRMSCSEARGRRWGRGDDGRCGPEARYFLARRWPVWLVTAAWVGLGHAVAIAYLGGLYLLMVRHR